MLSAEESRKSRIITHRLQSRGVTNILSGEKYFHDVRF